MTSTMNRPLHGQQNLHDVLRLADHTLVTAINQIDLTDHGEVLDSLAASRLLVATARERLEDSSKM